MAASVIALRCIFGEDVGRVGIIRQELIDHKRRLHHALVDVRPLGCHSRWMLLARSEEEWVLIVAVTDLLSVDLLGLHLGYVDRDLLA